MYSNIWKLQDAKARFSEVVRRARDGEPQTVTVHGEPAVVITAAKKPAKGNKTLTPGFNERSGGYREPDADLPPRNDIMTTAEFLERSKKYRGLGLKIPPRTKMKLHWKPVFGDDES